jgi:tetratricopeptide (TPR) repeat protein
MVRRFVLSTLTLALGSLLAGVPSTEAQYREYLVRGVVVDSNQAPIAGVTITLTHRGSTFRYQTETNAKGEYKAVGIPHGVFDVVVAKEGFETKTLEWTYPTSQQEMRRVSASPIVLLNDALARRIESNQKLQGYLKDAMELLDKRDVDGALAIAQRMLEERPDDPNGLFISGMCYLEQGHIPEATAALSEAAEQLPDYAPAHVRLGVCLQRQDRVDEALSCYDRALSLEPDNRAALYNAGAMLYGAGRGEEAFPYLEKALAAGVEDPNLDEMIGYCELQAGHYAEALPHLERARSRTTDDAQAASLDEILPSLREHVRAAPEREQ